MTDIETISIVSVTLIIQIAQANTKLLKWKNQKNIWGNPASWAPVSE